jgi:uncharacterized HAD superfamily protein
MKSALSLLRVGVDLDGVLNNLGETLLRELQSRGWAPPELQYDDITHYNFEEFIPGLKTEQLMEVFKKGDCFWDARPTNNALETLNELYSVGSPIHIVTSRNFSHMTRQITEEWLRRYDFPYHRLAIYGKGEKANYALAQGLDIFIEDHLPTALEMCDISRVSILLDHPYNRWQYRGIAEDLEPVNLLRMYSWKEIRNYIFRA